MVISAMSSTPGRSVPGDPGSPRTTVTHPNRHKPAVRTTRTAVILLLITSAVLILIITIGGWKVLQGAWIVQVGYIVIYALLAYFAGRWNRGVLPVAAVLAVLLAVFALVAGPAWLARDKYGFAQPALNAGLLGLLTLLIVPLQVLLTVFAMRGFSQGWNVELERRDTAAGTSIQAGAPPHPA
jgi:presenilin-like A22 family membrane protease